MVFDPKPSFLREKKISGWLINPLGSRVAKKQRFYHDVFQALYLDNGSKFGISCSSIFKEEEIFYNISKFQLPTTIPTTFMALQSLTFIFGFTVNFENSPDSNGLTDNLV